MNQKKRTKEIPQNIDKDVEIVFFLFVFLFTFLIFCSEDLYIIYATFIRKIVYF